MVYLQPVRAKDVANKALQHVLDQTLCCSAMQWQATAYCMVVELGYMGLTYTSASWSWLVPSP